MQRCPRCQRANPPDAAFCHNDGVPLDTLHLTGSGRFAREWRFPSGRACRNLEELVAACLGDWAEARNALVRRDFVRFFEDNNRPDLARLVPPAEPDAEVALQTFLEKLPTGVKPAPSLDVTPRRLLVPNVRRGEDRHVMLRVVNRGTGLLHGDILSPDSAKWLRIPPLQVRTNGGTVEVPVQVDFSVQGFPFHAFHVTDPQDLAKLMLARPKQAARWLADGSVRKLFDQHGWDYPLRGPLAPSLGAVQQYFEALGLSQVPRVSLDAAGFDITCEFPEVVTRAITLTTTSKKWVYAFVETGALWLRPRETTVAGGRQVDVVFDVDSEMMEPGRTHEGVLQLTVNGGVEHTIWVRVDVRRPYEPWTRKILKPFAG